MTEQNSLPPDDHELEQFLARRSELSRLHRASSEGEGAPPELDAPVLAQAQAELRRPLVRSRRLPRWSAPLAVAASLVLVVSLAWMAQQQPLPQAVARAPLPASPAANEGVVTESMAAQANAPLAAKAETPQQLKKISPALAMAAPRAEQGARKPSPPPQADRQKAVEALQAPSAIAMEQAVLTAAGKSTAQDTQGDQASRLERQSNDSLTSDDLNALFSEYSGRYKDKFADAANGAFEAENRNSVWANGVEEEVRKAVASNPSISIESGECHSSLCRYVLTPSEETAVKMFSRELVVASKATPYPVDVLRKQDSKSHEFIIYLFSLAPPADWVTELK